MSKSYNGCPASPTKSTIDVKADWGIVWKSRKMIWPGGVGQNQDLRDCFQYYVEQFYKRVENPVSTEYNKAGNWGYTYRANVNNPSSLSCHASGTAIDINAVRHPNGSRNTFTSAQYKEIGRILDELEGVLIVGVPGLKTPAGRVGGWTAASKPDEMHIEARSYDRAAWKRVANKIRPKLSYTIISTAPAAPAKPAPSTQSKSGQVTAAGVTVKEVQTLLNKTGAKLVVDGIYGALTTEAVRNFQLKHALRVDGIVGPETIKALRKPPVKTAPYPLKYGQVFGVWNEPTWAKFTRSGDPRWDGADIRNLVKTIQQRLQALGHAPKSKGWADGIYEKPTRDAVVKFQKANKLLADGLVGAKTWKALFQ